MFQSTDYGNFLANESSLQVSVIDEKIREKFVVEFQHLRNHASGPLATFLDYITYGYMIDNIVLLITGIDYKCIFVRFSQDNQETTVVLYSRALYQFLRLYFICLYSFGLQFFKKIKATPDILFQFYEVFTNCLEID